MSSMITNTALVSLQMNAPALPDYAGMLEVLLGGMSTALEEITGHGYVRTPGCYIGAVDAEDDNEFFEENMTRLTAMLCDQFAKSA